MSILSSWIWIKHLREQTDHLAILASPVSLGIKGRLITWIEDFLTNRKVKVAFQGSTQSHHWISTRVSSYLPNTLQRTRHTPSLHLLTDIVDIMAIISHVMNSAKKLQSALDIVATTAYDLDLFFSPTKTKIMKFKTNSQLITQLSSGTTTHRDSQDVQISRSSH